MSLFCQTKITKRLRLIFEETRWDHDVKKLEKTIMVILTRVNVEKHMDRWYMVGVQATLFETWSVVCFWGSRRSRYQRVRVIRADNQKVANQIAEKIIKRKIQRGYR
jgi:predicted DNA-binding WGR domain protein